MNISQRERYMILAAALVVAVVASILIVRHGRGTQARAISPAREQSLTAIHQDVMRKTEIRTTLERLQEDLSVKIPTVTPEDQVQNFVNRVESISGALELGLTSFQPRAGAPGRAAAARSAGSKVTYDLRFSSSHENLIKFLTAMESDGLPYLVESFDVRTGGQPDNLTVSMELSLYLLEPFAAESGEVEEEGEEESA